MKHFGLKVVLTVLLAAGMVVAFGWIVAWQNYRKISGDLAQEKPLNREAVNYTLKNLSESWDDYEARITNRYEVEAVFAALALERLPDDGAIDGGTALIEERVEMSHDGGVCRQRTVGPCAVN